MPSEDSSEVRGTREFAIQSHWGGRWRTGAQHFATKRDAQKTLDRLLDGPATLPDGSARSPYRMVSRPVQRTWDVEGEPV